MLWYPASVVYADSGEAAFFVEAPAGYSVAAYGWPAETFGCVENVDTFMQTEMFYGAPIIEAETTVLSMPATESQESESAATTLWSESTAADSNGKKKRRHGRKKGRAKDLAAFPENTSSIVEACSRENHNLLRSINAELGKDSERCNQIIAQLNLQRAAARPLIDILLPIVRPLSFSKHGSRITQKLIEIGLKEDLSHIVEELKGSITELYKSPHGNYVLSKMIEVLPATSLSFMTDQLQGSIVDLAQHQFGCRLVERLLEHCPNAAPLQELLLEVEPLCCHQYGNFVMQHIFEHGPQAWKEQIIEQIGDIIPQLAKHRQASHVVQKALECGGEEIQRRLVLALMNGKDDDSLLDVACCRFGSYVVEELSNVPICHEHVRQLLEDGIRRLKEDRYGVRVASRFGLVSGPTDKA